MPTREYLKRPKRTSVPVGRLTELVKEGLSVDIRILSHNVAFSADIRVRSRYRDRGNRTGGREGRSGGAAGRSHDSCGSSSRRIDDGRGSSRRSGQWSGRGLHRRFLRRARDVGRGPKAGTHGGQRHRERLCGVKIVSSGGGGVQLGLETLEGYIQQWLCSRTARSRPQLRRLQHSD